MMTVTYPISIPLRLDGVGEAEGGAVGLGVEWDDRVIYVDHPISFPLRIWEN